MSHEDQGANVDAKELKEIAESLCAQLAESNLHLLARTAQRDAANNRVKYLENLIRECFGKSGVTL